MYRLVCSVSAIVLFVTAAASAQSLPPAYASAAPRQMILVPAQPAAQTDLGGGFIEFIFGGNQARASAPPSALAYPQEQQPVQPIYVNTTPGGGVTGQPAGMDPRYLRQEVDYHTTEAPGTIVIDTPNKFLYLVEPGGKAMRYGIGVGRPGFTWSGVHHISAKKEWPGWTPPEEMLQRQPYLPHFMAGGPNNPLGARALYLGSTLYRIHGSNEPWTIGHNVSSGCIRLTNQDVIDLYGRVPVGAKVVVM
jgi:lipoprotein-anchoring transpeptidase ErfK/SrfK